MSGKITVTWMGLNRIASQVRVLSAHVSHQHVNQWAYNVAAPAEVIVNNEIQSGRGTKTGKARIRTHAMIGSNTTEVEPLGAGLVNAKAGFKDGPDHTVFQELGTKHITAMNSIIKAQAKMERDVPRHGLTMLNNIRRDWNQIG